VRRTLFGSKKQNVQRKRQNARKGNPVFKTGLENDPYSLGSPTGRKRKSLSETSLPNSDKQKKENKKFAYIVKEVGDGRTKGQQFRSPLGQQGGGVRTLVRGEWTQKKKKKKKKK